MRNISKTNAAKMTELHERMNSIEFEYNGIIGDLEAQINEVINEFKAKQSERLKSLQSNYNQTAEELKGITLNQHESMMSYMSKRTDKWLDSDAGFNYRFWAEMWEEFGDFLEIAEYREFDIQVRLETLEREKLPPFNPSLK